MNKENTSKDQNGFMRFFYHKKPAFQRLGHFGCTVSAVVLGLLVVSFIVGITLTFSKGPAPSVSDWAGHVQWHHSCGILKSFNAFLLHRLFCAYKKGHVFSVKNSQILAILGLFNLLLCSTMGGIFSLVLSVVLPDHEPS
jgi:hypothetical protein